MLSDFARTYINASVPVLRERCVAITHTFNRNFFKTYPELKHDFNMECKTSALKPLASIVFAYAANIDHAERFQPIIRRLVRKSASWGITAADYPIVGSYFLDAIKETLGYAATTHLLAAWAEAFDLLTHALMQEECNISNVPGVNTAEVENANAL